MSTKDIAIATAKGAGLAAFLGLLAVGAYAEAENEARRLREQAEREMDEYTFAGYRYTNEDTSYVLKLVGNEGHFLHILIQPDEEFVVMDTNLPDVKIGKEVRLDARWTNEIEHTVSRIHSYRSDKRGVSFYGPLGERSKPLTFTVLKKGEYVGRFLPDYREATLEVI
jgi:hypothetical protein